MEFALPFLLTAKPTTVLMDNAPIASVDTVFQMENAFFLLITSVNHLMPTVALPATTDLSYIKINVSLWIRFLILLFTMPNVAPRSWPNLELREEFQNDCSSIRSFIIY